MNALKARLAERNDVDIAAHCLGVAIGLLPDYPAMSGWKFKTIFDGVNPLGTLLYDLLRRLAEEGILERVETPNVDRYRWNPHRLTYSEIFDSSGPMMPLSLERYAAKRCSFCWRGIEEVRHLVQAGPMMAICDSCVDGCVGLLREHEKP